MLGESTMFSEKLKTMEIAWGPFAKHVASQMHCHLSTPPGAEIWLYCMTLRYLSKKKILLSTY